MRSKLTHSVGARRQAGATLIEAMISLALSLIVTTAMVTLMGNSMGSATRIIEMSQLTDELRNAMSMMSRDIRRANYNSKAISCYANSDCGISGGPAEQYVDIRITLEACPDGEILRFDFGLDRDWNGNSNDDGAGAFRHRTVNDEGIRAIEMWVGEGPPDCSIGVNGWLAVTDPDFVDVIDFNVDDASSFSQDLVQEGGATITQRSRQVQMQIEGQLTLDNTIRRRIEDTIKVRNDLFL